MKENKMSDNKKKQKYMKLNKVLKSLKKLGFVTDDTDIQIYVTKEGSFNPDNLIFKCRVPVDQAEKAFGKYRVSWNQLKNVTEKVIPAFCFVLAYEEKPDMVEQVLSWGK